MTGSAHSSQRQDERMPSFPIIDSHVHLYDVNRLSYSWLERRPGINRPHLFEDYARATAGVEVEKLVFAEVWVDPHLNLAEADWLAEQAARHPAIAGMIAAAPLEIGRRIQPQIEHLRRHPTFRAIRRITEAEADDAYCLRPDFVEGVRLLGEQGIVCDVCVFHHQLPGVIGLARLCPDTTIVLDHIGKPPIRTGERDPWRDNLRQLAVLPNVHCKISGVVTEADQANWSREIIRPYVDHAIECFGFDRIMFGSDWPVLALTIGYGEWVEMVDWIVEGCAAGDRRKLYRDNAANVYRL